MFGLPHRDLPIMFQSDLLQVQRGKHVVEASIIVLSHWQGRLGFRHEPLRKHLAANGVGHHPLDYSHPRSLKAERSTPEGAYHPRAPYRAPSFIAMCLLP